MMLVQTVNAMSQGEARINSKCEKSFTSEQERQTRSFDDSETACGLGDASNLIPFMWGGETTCLPGGMSAKTRDAVAAGASSGRGCHSQLSIPFYYFHLQDILSTHQSRHPSISHHTIQVYRYRNSITDLPADGAKLWKLCEFARAYISKTRRIRFVR